MDLKTEYNNVCAHCGGYGDTREHVIPRSRGGSNDPRNLLCLCWDCNVGRQNYKVDVLKFYKHAGKRRLFELIKYLWNNERRGLFEWGGANTMAEYLEKNKFLMMDALKVADKLSGRFDRLDVIRCCMVEFPAFFTIGGLDNNSVGAKIIFDASNYESRRELSDAVKVHVVMDWVKLTAVDCRIRDVIINGETGEVRVNKVVGDEVESAVYEYGYMEPVFEWTEVREFEKLFNEDAGVFKDSVRLDLFNYDASLDELEDELEDDYDDFELDDNEVEWLNSSDSLDEVEDDYSDFEIVDDDEDY